MFDWMRIDDEIRFWFYRDEDFTSPMSGSIAPNLPTGTRSVHCCIRTEVAPNKVGGTLSVSLGIPFVTFFHIEMKCIPEFVINRLGFVGDGRYEPRCIDVAIHDYAFWWNLWGKKWEGGRRSFLEGSFHPITMLFGQMRLERDTVETAEVMIPTPEGAAPATVKIEMCTWSRPRWPFRFGGAPLFVRQLQHDTELHDRPFSLFGPASTIEEAIQKTSAAIAGWD